MLPTGDICIKKNPNFFTFWNSCVTQLMIKCSKLAEVISNYSNLKELFPLRFKQPFDMIRLKSIAICWCERDPLEMHVSSLFKHFTPGIWCGSFNTPGISWEPGRGRKGKEASFFSHISPRRDNALKP